MEKCCFILMLAAAAQTACAQQLSNTTFDGEWENCYPWEAGAKVSSARGTQPKGWCISNVSQSALPVVGEEVTPGANGSGKAVKLSNVSASIGSNTAPAYITLGTAWATAETKMTSVREADGGVFGGIAFAYHPDAVRLTYKHDVSNGSENMSFIAYLWKGTWTQKDVPSNTSVGVFSWGSATKVSMTDRIQNILGKDCLTGGEITKTDDAALIASAEYYSSVAHDDWVTREIPLDYGSYAGKSVKVEKLNIVVASNGLFDDRSLIKAGNSITVDDVELVYYHALSALSYEGTTLNFSEQTTSYNLDEVYDESKLSYTLKGQASTATKSYDAESGILTIRVEGEDIAVNSNSFTEYKIQFATEQEVEKLIPRVMAKVTELVVDESTDLILENCDGLVAEYTVPGIISYADGKVTALSEGTTTLILTQPETKTILGKVFEIEFTVIGKQDVAWQWNVEDKHYYPNTTIENAFQLISGDTDLFTFGTSNSKIAKIRNGNLIIGEQTGLATITVNCKGNSKWKACKKQYYVTVAAPNHVPYELTQKRYDETRNWFSSGSWDENGGIRMGTKSDIFGWSNKDFVLEISGIPDKLSFEYSSSTGASSRDYRIFESADGENFTEIWRDNKGSGIDGNSYWCRDLQLSPETRFIRFHYYGNCAAYYRYIAITELVKFEVDKQEMVLNETNTTGEFSFTHANAYGAKITITAPNAITVTPSEIVGGFDLFGQETVSVSYNVDEGDVDDYIVISNGTKTKKIHVKARLENPDAIDGIQESNTSDSDVYNLSGQRINKLQKGINIVGGKKVLK